MEPSSERFDIGARITSCGAGAPMRRRARRRGRFAATEDPGTSSPLRDDVACHRRSTPHSLDDSGSRALEVARAQKAELGRRTPHNKQNTSPTDAHAQQPARGRSARAGDLSAGHRRRPECDDLDDDAQAEKRRRAYDESSERAWTSLARARRKEEVERRVDARSNNGGMGCGDARRRSASSASRRTCARRRKSSRGRGTDSDAREIKSEARRDDARRRPSPREAPPKDGSAQPRRELGVGAREHRAWVGDADVRGGAGRADRLAPTARRRPVRARHLPFTPPSGRRQRAARASFRRCSACGAVSAAPCASSRAAQNVVLVLLSAELSAKPPRPFQRERRYALRACQSAGPTTTPAFSPLMSPRRTARPVAAGTCTGAAAAVTAKRRPEQCAAAARRAACDP